MWFPSKKRHNITSEEGSWIEENFSWLVETFGLATLKKTPLVFVSETHFPTLYAEDSLSLDGCLTDLIKHFRLDDIQVDLKFKKKEGTPHILKKKNAGDYTIELHEIPEDINEVIYRLAVNCSKIKLLEEGVDVENEDASDLFLFMTLVFFGFGDFITNKIFKEQNGQLIKDSIDHDIAARIIHLYLALKQAPVATDWFSTIKKPLKNTLNKPATKNFVAKIEALDFVVNKIKNAWQMYDAGMNTLAISVCREVLPQDPSNLFLLDSLAYFLLREQHYEEAIKHLLKVIDIDKDFAPAQNNLGYAYLMTNELEKGNHHLKIAFSLDNHNALIERNLGIYKASIGNINEAIQHFDRAIELDKDTELIYYFIGLTYLEQGEKEKAVQAFKDSAAIGEKESIDMLANLSNE